MTIDPNVGHESDRTEKGRGDGTVLTDRQ